MKPRPIRIEGDVAYVTLTRGYEAIIDAENVPLVEGYNWQHIGPNRQTNYARRNGLVSRGENTRSGLYMHRVILDAPAGLEVDHIDGNGLNNRRGNLRLATPSQNSCNKGVTKSNTSGYKGVFWEKGRGKWRALIRLNYKLKHLGFFDTPEKAYKAYCEASDKLHGEFGRVK